MKQKIKMNIFKKKFVGIFLGFLLVFCFFNINSANASFLEYTPIGTGFDIAKSFWGSAVGSFVSDTAGNVLLLAFNWLLYGVWLLLSFFILIAGLLFDWAINPDNITGIIGNQVIYSGWMIVRDFFNLSFILVLLFSAFSTIFQIEKYHLLKKNILLMVVVMALLINFSFPVARFIIDTTNVTMYFFVDQAFPGYNYSSNSLSSHFLSNSQIIKMTIPVEEDGGVNMSADSGVTFRLLLLIIYSFVLAMTIIVLAGVFLVRIIALALIIVFAPLGFIGPIFPSFSKMGEWWDYLFKYALVGPVMMFMVLLSLRLTEALGNTPLVGLDSIKAFSGDYKTAESSDLIIAASYFVIPTIILWFSVILAGKMNIYGAGKITSFATSAGRWVAKAPGRTAMWGARSSGLSDGVKKATDEFKKTGTIFGRKPIPLYGGSEAKALREEKIGGVLSQGKMSAAKEAQVEYERKQMLAIRKEWKDKIVDEATIQKKLKNGSNFEKKAAAMEMVEERGFGEKDKFFADAQKAVSDDKALKEIFTNKTKEKRIDLHIKTEISNILSNTDIPQEKKATQINNAINEIGKLGVDKWQKQQNIEGIFSDSRIKEAAKQAIGRFSEKQLDEITKNMSEKNQQSWEKLG